MVRVIVHGNHKINSSRSNTPEVTLNGSKRRRERRQNDDDNDDDHDDGARFH